MSELLRDRISKDGFAGYAYAYPHKTSYRPLSPTIPLADAWSDEDKAALFLYVHLPFCEMRCGFCNLFTTIQPDVDYVAETLNAIDRQSRVVADEIKPNRISQLAFGGGTPSFLSVDELRSLFENLSMTWPIAWEASRCSFESSPATITKEKLELLRSYHVDRISMGVQSFSEHDLKQLGRPQSSRDVISSIEMIKDCGFPVFNLDLIYGVDGQTESSWMETVERTIDLSPEEVFLYPLYVRALTGLGRTGKSPSEHRRVLFLRARDALIAAGYRQHSMRLFRKQSVDFATDYCCQEDGMVGLGPGARSYTRDLHYSSEYAVGQKGVRQIIAKFNSRALDDFRVADFGVRLNDDERRRRYVIKSLLHVEGLDIVRYKNIFHSDVLDDFPQLTELLELDLAIFGDRVLHLTTNGLSWSDVIGPWLYSKSVTAQMEECELV